MTGYEMLKQKGKSAFAFNLRFENPLGIKFFPIGDLIINALIVYGAFYVGFTILGLALLGKLDCAFLPEHIEGEGLLIIELAMGSLMGFSGYCIYILYRDIPREIFPKKNKTQKI